MRSKTKTIRLPSYYYKLLYIIDLMDLERDWGKGLRKGEIGGAG